MPKGLLAQLKRTPEEQVLWERLPKGLRRRLLVWIDCLYFPSEESMTPRKVVWFVDQRTDRDWRVDWPVPEPCIDLLIVQLCLIV
jgi:hypothetical protein